MRYLPCPTLALSAALALATLAAPAAVAHEAGDIIVRFGTATATPLDHSGDISTAATGDIDGSGASVNTNTQLGITATYMITDYLGIGLLGATPFQHMISIDGVGAVPDGSFATVKDLPPTLTLQFFPMEAASPWQPYVGFGVNYTNFFDAKLKSSRKAEGFSDLSLSDSWGWAAQIGLDYMLTDNIVLNASLWYIDIDTEAKFDSAFGRGKVNVDVNPLVYMFGVGYRF